TLRQVEYHGAAKRDPGQEAPQGDAGQERLMHLLDRDPSPEAVVAFLDELEHFLNQLNPLERKVVELRLRGDSNEDVARELGVLDRRGRRIVERARGLAGQQEFDFP